MFINHYGVTIIWDGFLFNFLNKTNLNKLLISEFMYIPKKYGLSRVDNCPFCGKSSVVKNSQGIPVCQKHRGARLDGLKCVCGEWLEINLGKWGPYFRCLNCGNINFKKGLEMNPQLKNSQVTNLKSKESKPKEITITSDQLDFL